MKKVYLVVMPVLTILLELLPFGTVCIFATATSETIKKTYSYFDLLPFGYGDFAPLITAILTIFIFLLSLFSLKKMVFSKYCLSFQLLQQLFLFCHCWRA